MATYPFYFWGINLNAQRFEKFSFQDSSSKYTVSHTGISVGSSTTQSHLNRDNLQFSICTFNTCGSAPKLILATELERRWISCPLTSPSETSARPVKNVGKGVLLRARLQNIKTPNLHQWTPTNNGKFNFVEKLHRNVLNLSKGCYHEPGK